jgi:hypothetical protein
MLKNLDTMVAAQTEAHGEEVAVMRMPQGKAQ